MKLFFQTLILLFIGSCLSQTMFAQDPVAIAPKIYRTRLDNNKVRVLDVWLKPGDKVALHGHPDYVSYALSSGIAKFTDEKGKATRVVMKAGQCTWHNEEKHTVQNVGKHPLHVLCVEVKGFRWL